MSEPIKDTGGSAFPEIRTDSGSDEYHQPYSDTYSTGGMSVRDWFAGQAIAAGYMFGEHPDKIATNAYELADAMLRARQREGQDK